MSFIAFRYLANLIKIQCKARFLQVNLHNQLLYWQISYIVRKNTEAIICYLVFSLSFRRPDAHAKGSYALLRKCLVCSSACTSVNYLHHILLFFVPCFLDVLICIVDSWTCEALWSTLVVFKWAIEINLTLTYMTCTTGPSSHVKHGESHAHLTLCRCYRKMWRVHAQKTATPLCFVCLHCSAGTATLSFVVLWSLFCTSIIAAVIQKRYCTALYSFAVTEKKKWLQIHSVKQGITHRTDISL